jgi:uncharacterized protein YgbK (DUF1537 family)
VVFDGRSDDDVMEAARKILVSSTFRIVAGPAAIAGALAACLGAPAEIAWPKVPRCLVVNGSRHQVSLKQIEGGLESRAISMNDGAPWRLLRREIGAGTDPLQVARETGNNVHRMLSEHEFDGVLVFGGDTAFAIVENLGTPLLRPIGEMVAGVPVTLMEGRREVLITKAGGFGPPDLLARLRSSLNG